MLRNLKPTILASALILTPINAYAAPNLPALCGNRYSKESVVNFLKENKFDVLQIESVLASNSDVKYVMSALAESLNVLQSVVSEDREPTDEEKFKIQAGKWIVEGLNGIKFEHTQIFSRGYDKERQGPKCQAAVKYSFDVVIENDGKKIGAEFDGSLRVDYIILDNLNKKNELVVVIDEVSGN